MSKKERNKEVVATEFAEAVLADEPVYEAEAYTAPAVEMSTDGTVMKQVGTGGPVPIVAPKYNTIQLQPIVVPLAVVPYMTQDAGVLRTDGRQQGGYVATAEEYGEATQFENVTEVKATKKKRKSQLPRIFSAISLLLAAFIVLLFVISDSQDKVGSLYVGELNFIGTIKHWVEIKQFVLSRPEDLVYIAVPAFTAVLVITSLIGLIVNRYPRPVTAIISCITIICLLVPMVWNFVENRFVLYEQAAFITVLCVNAVAFVLSVIFSIIINHKEDAAEQQSRYGREI